MSGKGKGKRKDKFKDDKTGFVPKPIDLKRLAYDVIKCTALKFRVPESCIAVWDGKGNTYDSGDFILYVCIPILEYQIKYRGQYHAEFNQRYESNKLATPALVGGLLYDVIVKVTRGFTLPPLETVHISLSIACELFLFLYSKNTHLNPKKLATTWFNCYLNTNIKKFENDLGLTRMYLEGFRKKHKLPFLNKFIEDHCLDYIASATNPDLKERFRPSADKYRKALLSSSQKKNDETSVKLENLNDIADRVTGIKIKIEPPAPDGATGFNPPENTGGPLDQVSQFSGSLVTSFQGLSVTSPELPWHHTILSKKERKKIIQSKMSSRRFTLDSSEIRQSSNQNPSFLTGTAQSYEHQGAIPKVPLQNTISSGLQTGESSSLSSWKRRLGQLSSDSSGTE